MRPWLMSAAQAERPFSPSSKNARICGHEGSFPTAAVFVSEECLTSAAGSLLYQTAVISNYASNLRPELTHQFGIADAFDEIIISCEEKVMKPDPEIFHRALARLGRKLAEAIFIDDCAHNVQAAQDVGLAAIHFQPGMDLAEALRQSGVSCG